MLSDSPCRSWIWKDITVLTDIIFESIVLFLKRIHAYLYQMQGIAWMMQNHNNKYKRFIIILSSILQASWAKID